METRPRRPLLRLRGRDVQLYRLADLLSGIVLSLMVVFCPWAFGTTVPWAIMAMNSAGYVLGLLLLCKLFIRFLKGHRPPRWDVIEGRRSRRMRVTRALTYFLAILTMLVLGYCLVSALNARATYIREAQTFEYRECLSWLPHSLDRHRSWQWFWNFLALAFAFWAIWDWLLGKTREEERRKPRQGRRGAHYFPARLRWFLWLLAINGALLGIEGIIQRLEGSGKLLFVVKPRVNPTADTQFGPWAYRANASQYFNLLWPVILGFWWTLHRARGFRQTSHHVLLVCAAIMASCPIISTSRGGAIISAGILILAVFFLTLTELLLFANKQEARATRWLTSGAVILFGVVALLLGHHFGWTALKPRLNELEVGYELREEMFDRARPMAKDYPWFGTGPGTFEPVFQLYREELDTYWPAQLHNDWLETRITFGILGTTLILLAFVCVLLRWFMPGGIHGGRRFVILAWLALAGCLVHARFDFPFQIYSILFQFLLTCAILFTLTRRPRG